MDKTILFKLSEQQRSLLRARAASEGKTMQGVFNCWLSTYLETNKSSSPSQAWQPKKKQISVALTESEREAIRKQAELMGFTTAGYVCALVRARLFKSPLLVRSEAEGLAEATAALGAVGRNLNVVVHRLHREGRWSNESAPIYSLVEAVKKLQDTIHEVIDAAMQRGAD
jgi:uncharacterized protein (DUF1778 family)